MAPTNKDGDVATVKAVDVLKQKAGAHHCLGNVHANLPVNKVSIPERENSILNKHNYLR